MCKWSSYIIVLSILSTYLLSKNKIYVDINNVSTLWLYNKKYSIRSNYHTKSKIS